MGALSAGLAIANLVGIRFAIHGRTRVALLLLLSLVTIILAAILLKPA